jgi:hypothetical protein
MSPELVAHSHVRGAAHPFKGSPMEASTERIAAGKKTRWLGPVSEPLAPILRATGVRIERPGPGAVAGRPWHAATVVLTQSGIHLRSETHAGKRVVYRIEDVYAASATTTTTLAVYFAHAKRPGTTISTS